MFSLRPFFYSVVLALSVSLSACEDRDALLAFKVSSDPTNSLSSWVDSSDSDPCSGSWLGVACDHRTRRVTRLVLENLNLSGSAQSLTRLTQLRLLSLSRNRLSSSSAQFNFSSWPNIKHLYLSNNEFAGIFPSGVSGLRRLRRLDLSHNRFHGEIPMSELNRLQHLLTVRLEGNEFTGTLDSVNSSASITDFNVSSNKLSGEIPPWMSGFPQTSFAGNEALCGKPLPRHCSNYTSQSQIEKPTARDRATTKRVSNRVLLIIIAADVAAVLAVTAAVWCWCGYLKRRPTAETKTHKNTNQNQKRNAGSSGYGSSGGEMVVFEGCKGFSGVDDLLKASAEMLGKGCAGTTYRVATDGGGAVAVKRVKERTKRREVDGWLRLIGGFRHCNAVSLRAYHYSRDELLLVYDFLPSGSLHYLLHGNRGPGRTPLEWRTRLKLASGAARGLAFLHCYNNCKLFHGHLTSSNIIIDLSGNACLADIGLYHLFPIPLSSSSSHSPYRAPELLPNNNVTAIHGITRKYSRKCDVYSFGVILLEMLTGKIANGEEGEGGGLGESLVKWVERKVVGKEWSCSELLDIELLGCKEMEDEMRALMEVALLCLAELRRDRPKMSVVSKMIGDIVGGKGRAEEMEMDSSVMDDLSSDSSPSLSEKTS